MSASQASPHSETPGDPETTPPELWPGSYLDGGSQPEWDLKGRSWRQPGIWPWALRCHQESQAGLCGDPVFLMHSPTSREALCSSRGNWGFRLSSQERTTVHMIFKIHS